MQPSRKAAISRVVTIVLCCFMLIGAAPLTDEVVVDGNVITSRAPGTAIPFAIALAELLTDEKTAAALTEDLVFRKA
mgnify:CR=1 FL=1